MELDENQCQDPADHINQRLKLKPFASVTNLCVFFSENTPIMLTRGSVLLIIMNGSPYQNAFI